MITISAAIAGLASAALAVNVSADEFVPDDVIVSIEPSDVSEVDYVPEVSDEPETISDIDYIPEVSDESAAPDMDYVPEVSDEPAAPDMDYVPEVSDEPAAVPDEDYVSEVSGESMVAYDPVNPNHLGTYWNGTSYIKITSSNNSSFDKCEFYMVNWGIYTNVQGTGGSCSITGSNFTAHFDDGTWFYRDSNGNVKPSTGNLDDINGTYNSNKKTITLNGVVYTKQ